LTEEEREQFAKDNETMEKERFAEQKVSSFGFIRVLQIFLSGM